MEIVQNGLPEGFLLMGVTPLSHQTKSPAVLLLEPTSSRKAQTILVFDVFGVKLHVGHRENVERKG